MVIVKGALRKQCMASSKVCSEKTLGRRKERISSRKSNGIRIHSTLWALGETEARE